MEEDIDGVDGEPYPYPEAKHSEGDSNEWPGQIAVLQFHDLGNSRSNRSRITLSI
jgi:hypothetical protein